MIGIIAFLIVVVLANILTYYVSNPFYHAGVGFINENFWLLLLIAIIMFVGAIFGAFPFPLNLPAPLIKAIGSIFCIAFILQVFQKVDPTNLYPMFQFMSLLIAPLIFILVLAGGYFEIMRQLWWQPRSGLTDDGQVVHESHIDGYPDERETGIKSWEEIGAEFRLVLYDILHRFRQEINRKE
jgi:peptidoglycan/LPS O-acetylase OafA/YrhL